MDTGGWDVDGFVNGEIKGSLQFSREQKKVSSGTKEALAQNEALPSWFYVTRTLELGMPWTVYTEITRSDSSRSQMMSLPLIGGEKVLDERIRVEEGRAFIDFPREQSSVSYRSELSLSDRLELKAEKEVAYSETWFVKCSRIWSCTASELPALTYKDSVANQYEMQFKPWPGESLKIDVKKKH